jgi:hypothetical protein
MRLLRLVKAMKTEKPKFPLFSVLLACFLLSVGFNTLDQMVIRYKFYNDWRTLDFWEMCFFFKPQWWIAYIFCGVIPLVVGGILIGFVLAKNC